MNRILCVGVGGGLGALLRYAVQNWIHQRYGAPVPYATVLVNVSGAFLIGLLMTLLLRHTHLAPEWRLFFVVGVLGGYTTFSSLTWEAYEYFSLNLTGQGVAYLGCSFFGGFAGLLLGVLLARLI